MADFKLEQRVYCKIPLKLRFSATNIQADLQKFVKKMHYNNYGAVAKWVHQFKNGSESAEDDERTGRPVAATSKNEIDFTKELIETDARYMVVELVQISGISLSSVCRPINLLLWPIICKKSTLKSLSFPHAA